ncbi:MAG: hypothetical protein FWF73_05440 [Spirochaetes bacterium]|nr:hypothetical protein [Spirochaetota bacterium]
MKIQEKKNNKFRYKILNTLIVALISSNLPAQEADIVFDNNFFKEFNKKQVIQRDEFLENITNKVVIGRGKIIEITPNQRYKKKYRIKIESSDSTAYSQNFIFFVFIENKDMVDLLSIDSKFEFKGQFMGYTPLSTKRNEYIIDIIIMDGSTVIE